MRQIVSQEEKAPSLTLFSPFPRHSVSIPIAHFGAIIAAMCGRFAYVPSPEAWAPIRDHLGQAVGDALRAAKARYNIAPSTSVPIVIQDRQSGQPITVDARWGFIPFWWKDAKPPGITINARAEEAATKPMWRDAWKKQRCLIPATHWYEWRQAQGMKIPHAITSGDGSEGFMFAGLWSRWTDPAGKEIISCAILTIDASKSVAHIHDRMPVVLAPAAWREWIDTALTAVPGMTGGSTISAVKQGRSTACRSNRVNTRSR